MTTITPYRFGTLYLLITNKETRTLKGLVPLLLKRRLFTKFQHVRLYYSIQVPRGIEPLKKVLTVLHINHSDMAPHDLFRILLAKRVASTEAKAVASLRSIIAVNLNLNLARLICSALAW